VTGPSTNPRPLTPDPLVDTHVHLNHDDLYADRASVMARAAASGVGVFVVVGYDLASSERAVALAGEDERIFATVGVHPHDAANWGDAAAGRLRALLAAPRVVAVGEIGLDFYRDLSPREAQRAAFVAQLKIASEAGLPVVIHCRDAYSETLDILEGHDPLLPPILHCFQGTLADAERAWTRGWFLGIGGALTFKNGDALRATVRAAPPECLLLETDAPYLSPAPLRGKYPNEPARLALVAETLAAVRGVSVQEVAALTTANARRAFPRLSAEGGYSTSSSRT